MQLLSLITSALRSRVTRIQIVRFVISFILATLLWGWVTQIQDPMQEREFTAVPITVSGLADSLILITTLPNAEVAITGPRSDIQDVRLADISLNMDLTGIDEPGTERVRVTANAPSGVDVDNVTPSEIQVQVEEVVTEVYQLFPEPTLSEDDPRQVGTVTPTVTQVTVTGPSSAMARIARVVLPITVTQQTSDFEAEFTPRAVDAENQTVADVTILPGQVQTAVELRTRGKEISVIPVVTGSPAEGFSVQQKSVVPEVILVDGPEDILDSLLFVNTEPVNINGATSSVSQRVAIGDLPDGVTILEPSDGIVELRVAIEDTTNTAQIIPSIPIEVTGLDPGLQAVVDPQVTSITIDAPQSRLQALAVSDISVGVFVEGLGPGTYQLQIDVQLPAGVSLVSTDQQIVRVTISRADASPESTPEPGD